MTAETEPTIIPAPAAEPATVPAVEEKESTITKTPEEPTQSAALATDAAAAPVVEDNSNEKSSALPVEPVTAASSVTKKEKKVVISPPTTVLSSFFDELPAVLKESDHNEMWGVELQTSPDHVPTSIILTKFLRANGKDILKAKAQLIAALKWRKSMQPLKLFEDSEFSEAKFGGLGYVTTYTNIDGKSKEVVTWNIYGAVKDSKLTFGNVEE